MTRKTQGKDRDWSNKHIFELRLYDHQNFTPSAKGERGKTARWRINARHVLFLALHPCTSANILVGVAGVAVMSSTPTAPLPAKVDQIMCSALI